MPSKSPRIQDDDPLTRAIAPPPNETPDQREARLLSEQEAKRISDAIDEDINRQRTAKKSKHVKILLLGEYCEFTDLDNTQRFPNDQQAKVNQVCSARLL
jgi:hypothetical protein